MAEASCEVIGEFQLKVGRQYYLKAAEVTKVKQAEIVIHVGGASGGVE